MSAVILVVDDEPSVRTSMLRLLTAQGYQAVEAIDPTDALRKAEALHPDVILMDILMPGMGGIETARSIKAHPVLGNTPIIATSATPPRSAELGRLFDAVLVKPCPSTKIFAAIEGALGR